MLKFAALVVLFSSPLLAAPQMQRLPQPATDADFFSSSRSQVELGRALFFDKILSGNRNMSCATCHHSLTDTGDGLSLPVGEGGRGLGMTRDTGAGSSRIHERVPRNAPPIFNLGAKEFERMFHDGRVEVDRSQPSGFRSPAGNELPLGLDSALAVQAMFPVTSGTEMAGQLGENPVANAAAVNNLAGPGGVWELLARRLQLIPEYVAMFERAYPQQVFDKRDITFMHAANAIAAFEGTLWRATNSAFDRFLRGEDAAMSASQKQGMQLFYGKASCFTCHSGTFQTDHQFYAIAIPQIGPGKGDGPHGYEDFGRERVSSDPADRYRFRTPTLRNVALTGPWGHDGAYNSLEDIILHHLDPVQAVWNYNRNQAVLPPDPALDPLDFRATSDVRVTMAIGVACELVPRVLSDDEVARLIDFMHALTDPASLDLRKSAPFAVPSGLPLAE